MLNEKIELQTIGDVVLPLATQIVGLSQDDVPSRPEANQTQIYH
jgi:hypothetical protein